jgi:hypothetical protein
VQAGVQIKTFHPEALDHSLKVQYLRVERHRIDFAL